MTIFVEINSIASNKNLRWNVTDSWSEKYTLTVWIVSKESVYTAFVLI